jgi:diguanylate cyclase (GGDEF)-like protein
MSDDFLPRAAIVTGSDSGIGRATAVALAKAGLDVGVTWHQDEQGTGPGGREQELGQGIAGEVARDGRAKTTDERGTPLVSVATDRLAASLGVPMIVGARVVGVIEMQFDPPCEVDAEVVSMVETLASHAGTAIEAARLHEATRELSQIDALTTLYNRRRMDSDLADEVARSSRYGHPLSFVMADLDHFKHFNDTYGHQRGDEVLQEVARFLAEGVRNTDTVYRYGGEELSILFRETSLEDARDLAERLRSDIERHFPASEGQRTVTISMGLAALSDRNTSPELIVGAADAALYGAKSGGRNQVAVDGT